MEVRKNKLKPKPVIARPSKLGRGNLRKQLLTLLVIASLLIPVLPVSASEPTQTQINAMSKAVNYLRSQQAKDGSISNPSVSGWSAMAFAAAGLNPQTIKKTKGIPAGQQRSLMDYLKNYSQTTLKNPGSNVLATDYARQILAAYTIEPYPHGFGGVNLLKQLGSYYDGNAKQFVHPQDGGAYVNDDIFAIIAYSAATPIAAESYKYIDSVNFLLGKQNNNDGGFSWSANSSASDVDDTAAALQALVLAKRAGIAGLDAAIQKAYDYLKTSQNSDGGFPYDPSDAQWGGNLSNASSTAWAVQAIVAYKDKTDLANFIKNGNDPISYLLSLQKNDGSYGGWDGSSDPYTTSLVIPALAKTPWPIRWNTNSRLLSTIIGIRGNRRIVLVGRYLTIGGTLSLPRSGYVYLRYKRSRSKWRTLKRIRVNGSNFKTKVKIMTANRYIFVFKYGADTSSKIFVYGRRRK